MTTTEQKIECLNDHDGECKGVIELRPSLTGTGTAIARCDHHWAKRLDEEERITDTYGPDSDVPPAWFHGSYGGANEFGEHWDSD